jgi:hypothetical protein
MVQTMNSAPGRLSFEALRRFAPRNQNVEVCELCSSPIAPEHRHLLEPAQRRIMCACDGCAVLFSNDAKTRFKAIPRTGKLLRDFQMSDAQWDAFAVPIGLAFFFQSSRAEKTVAFYPSPAGATESLLDLAAWNDLIDSNPVLATMQADVEALLVNRIGEAREYYLLPIDECYRLVGLIRANWHGLSGGHEVWRNIEEFFAALMSRYA